MQRGSDPSARWRLTGPRYVEPLADDSLVEVKKLLALTIEETARMTVPGMGTGSSASFHHTTFAFDPTQELLWTGNEAVSLDSCRGSILVWGTWFADFSFLLDRVAFMLGLGWNRSSMSPTRLILTLRREASLRMLRSSSCFSATRASSPSLPGASTCPRAKASRFGTSRKSR